MTRPGGFFAVALFSAITAAGGIFNAFAAPALEVVEDNRPAPVEIDQKTDPNVEPVLGGIQKFIDGTNSIEASFEQKAIATAAKRPMSAAGKVFIGKRGKIRFDYLKPERQTIVSDGQTLFYYLPDEGSVAVKHLDKNISARSPLIFLTGSVKISAVFTGGFAQPPDSDKMVYKVRLTPKTDVPGLDHLVLHSAKSDYAVVAAEIADPYGNVTAITFRDIVRNGKLPDGIFEFIIPAGTETVPFPGE